MMTEYHRGKWVVYAIPSSRVGKGDFIASCWIGVANEIPENYNVLYEGDSYEDAQQYISDVRDLVTKPKQGSDQ